MSNPENPFDQTVWDPSESEQAIEDPLHGSEAILNLHAIPPMPKPDGTFHVFGGLYLCGTTSFDAEGRPFIRIGSGRAMYAAIRESRLTIDWVNKYRAGELPPAEEMSYPEFRYDVQPYLIVDQAK